MDHKTLSRLFEPFYTTKGANGTGLGLWISAGILKRHHARMRVKTRRDRGHSGTVFSMLFPVDVVEAATNAGEADSLFASAQETAPPLLSLRMGHSGR
jgi:signal transduction histidine kinase